MTNGLEIQSNDSELEAICFQPIVDFWLFSSLKVRSPEPVNLPRRRSSSRCAVSAAILTERLVVAVLDPYDLVSGNRRTVCRLASGSLPL